MLIMNELFANVNIDCLEDRKVNLKISSFKDTSLKNKKISGIVSRDKEVFNNNPVYEFDLVFDLLDKIFNGKLTETRNILIVSFLDIANRINLLQDMFTGLRSDKVLKTIRTYGGPQDKAEKIVKYYVEELIPTLKRFRKDLITIDRYKKFELEKVSNGANLNWKSLFTSKFLSNRFSRLGGDHSEFKKSMLETKKKYEKALDNFYYTKDLRLKTLTFLSSKSHKTETNIVTYDNVKRIFKENFRALLDNLFSADCWLNPKDYVTLLDLASEYYVLYSILIHSKEFLFASRLLNIGVFVEGPDKVGKDTIAMELTKTMQEYFNTDTMEPYLENYEKGLSRIMPKLYRVNSMRSSFEDGNTLGHMAKYSSGDYINIQTRQTLNTFNSIMEQDRHVADSILNKASKMRGFLVGNRSPLSSFVYYITDIAKSKDDINQMVKDSLNGANKKDDFLYKLYLNIINKLEDFPAIKEDRYIHSATNIYRSDIMVIMMADKPYIREKENNDDYFEKKNKDLKVWKKRKEGYESLISYLQTSEVNTMTFYNYKELKKKKEFKQLAEDLMCEIIGRCAIYSYKNIKK